MRRRIRKLGCIAMMAAATIYSYAQPGHAQKASSSARVVPKFVVDPSWPTMPNGWVFGQVSSAASDKNGNIWVLQRSRTIRAHQKTGPPVMVFDQAGRYVRGWGGPGKGYDWPAIEHGITIDYKGFVWISGSGEDDQVLKFTQDGKFVMQIGHPGHKKTNRDTESFWKPADVFVYPKTNEVFVADGYGNKRVIVFDAETGQFKRMWGAFGNVPSDDPPPPKQVNADPLRVPAKDLPADDPGPPQFSTVHGIQISNDGLVYVSDRGGKRVQVFTIEGRFVKQVFVDRWCEAVSPSCGNGETVASTAFSPDREQRFLYVASRSPEHIWIYDRKTLQPLTSFGQIGVKPGEFDVLHHMTIDGKGNLYTSEVEDGRRIQKFSFKGLIPLLPR